MEKPLRSIIIDDEPTSIANLEVLLHSHPEIRIIDTISDLTISVDSIIAKKA